MTPNIFVTGTDTDVGKTFISALLVKAWGANYWKPLQTGSETDPGDTLTVKDLTGFPSGNFCTTQIVFKKPLSPWRAAILENKKVELDSIQVPTEFENNSLPLIIEGAGGLFVPINENDITSDLITHLDVPVILVARSGLGTINHTLLSIEHLKMRGIKVLGIIMNGELNEDNCESIQHFAKDIPVICQIPYSPSKKIDDFVHLVPKLSDILKS